MSENNEKRVITLIDALNKNTMKKVGRNGNLSNIYRVNDEMLQSSAIELIGITPKSTYITVPELSSQYITNSKGMKTIHMVVKNINKSFSFEFTVIDAKRERRTFNLTTSTNLSRIKQNYATLPLKLVEGWNIFNFDFDVICQKIYGYRVEEFIRLQVNANCRIRRVFLSTHEFTDKDYKNRNTWVFQDFEAEATA